MAFDLNTAKPVSAAKGGGFDLNTAKPGGFDLSTAKPAVAPMPQTDEIVSSMFGLKREPSGQTYFEAPVSKTPQELAQMPLYESIPTDMAQTFGGGVRAVVGGARNAVAGVAGLPADIAEALGGGRSPMIDGFINNLPEIRQEGVTGEIVQALTQYAPAAVAGASLIPSAAKEAPRLTKLATGAAKTGMAALADMLVTNPDQASTLGDLLEAGPTAIQPDDSNLTKRVKVGAETPVGEMVGKMVGKMVKGGWNAAVGLKNMYDIKGKTAQRLQDAANSDPASSARQAAEQIGETQAAIPDPGFKPMTGESTTNVGLLQMQKGLAEETPLVSQRKANEENIAQQFSGTTAGSGVDRSPELRQAVEGEAAGIVAPARQQLETTQKNLNDVNAQMDAIKAEVNNAKGQKVTSSQQIAQTVRDVGAKLTSAKNELYSKIDPDGKAQVDGSDLIADIEAIEPRTWQNENVAPTSVQKSAAKAKENGGGVSFRDLMDLRAQLNEDMSTALKAGGTKQGGLYQNLAKIKTSVDAKIAEIGNSTDPALADVVENYKLAQDNYANIYAPVAKQGVSGKVLQAAKGSQPVPDSVVGNEFLRRGKGSTERVQSFNLVKEQTDDAAGLEEAGYKWVLDDFAQNALKGGEITPESIQAWRELEGTKEILDQMPSVKAEIGRIQNLVGAGSGKKTQFMKDLEAAKEGVKRSEKEIAQSALGTVLNTKDAGETSKAVAKVLNGDNKVQRFKQLKAAASKDTSGKAMEGLRNAVGDWMESKAYTAKSGEGRTLETASKKPSFGGIETLLEDKANKEIIESMFEGKDLQALRQVRSKLEVMSRLGRVQGTVGSSAAGNQQAKEAIDGLTFIATSNWRANKALRLAFSALPSGADPEVHVQRMLVRSMADPELARTLLLKPVGKDAKKFEEGIRTYITNNVIGTGEERRQKNEEDDNIPQNKGDK
jgi:hypothetical protein